MLVYCCHLKKLYFLFKSINIPCANTIWSWVLSLYNFAPLYLSNSTSVCCFFYGAFTATGKLCYFAQTNEICYVQKFSTRLRIEGKVLLQHTCWMKTLFRYLLTYTKNHCIFILYFLDAYMKKRPSGQKQLQLLPLLVIIYHIHVNVLQLPKWEKNCYVIADKYLAMSK